MILVCFIVFFLNIYTDMCGAHVFCQDAHASRWTPLGYSCPLNCPSVVEAVDKLKMIDFQEFFTLQQQAHYMVNRNTSEEDSSYESYDDQVKPKRRYNEIQESNVPTPSHYHELYKILLNKKSVNEIQALFKIVSTRLKNVTCRTPKNIGRRKKHDAYIKKCAGMYFEQDNFLKKFTAILNKYTISTLFTEDLTAIILVNLLSKNMDYHLVIFDVKKILKHVREAISEHKRNVRAAGATITLKSKFCLNVYVPGCFCIAGFVEDHGQCVKPRDCFPESSNVNEYLARIILH